MYSKNYRHSTKYGAVRKLAGFCGKQLLAVERRFRQSIPFSGAEQAEVGQWPYLLALSYRYRGFKYPPGILVGLSGR
jgi:hypothetical protein